LTPQPAKAPAPGTRRAETALRLLFAGRPVDVAQPGSMLLGRDPDNSPVAALFAVHDNVSRRHASVGIEPDGTAWVRDEHSTNGTFVNDIRVPSGGTAPLVHGDQLRIASNMVAQVELGQSG
jgi:pSer/pThr/pTyr-binding forkhead associated (FHA) protein